jgi:hypothetical protein
MIAFTFSVFKQDKLFIPTHIFKKENRIQWNHKIFSLKTTKKSGQTIQERIAQFNKSKVQFKVTPTVLSLDKHLPLKLKGEIHDLRRTVIKGVWKNEDLVYDLFVPKQKSFWNKFEESSDEEDETTERIHEIDSNTAIAMLRTGQLSENKEVNPIQSNYGILDYLFETEDPLENAED